MIAAGLLAGRCLAQEQAGDYPAKPVTIISPYAGSSAVDVETRYYTDSIQATTGKVFIFDFKGGAGTTIGINYVAKASPDGYTLLASNSGLTITPAVYPDLPYDNIRDLAPITLLLKHPLVWVVNPALPFRTMGDYVNYAKAHPNELNFGTGGIGSSTHLPGELLHYLSNTRATMVHYKVPSQKTLDIIGGRIQSAVFSFVTAMPLAKAGKLRILGVTTNKRLAQYPEIPTIEEQGVAGYDFSSWGGLLAPGRTSPAIVNRLNGMFVTAGRDPAVIKRLESDATIMVGSTPAGFRDLIATETARYRKLVTEAGVKLNE